MKIAFSTLACPRWTFSDVYTTAKDLGFDGIEIRGIADEMFAPKIKAFDKSHIYATIEKLNKLAIEIPILTSASELAVYSKQENAISEAYAYIDLAQKLSIPYVRVMCTNSPQPDGGDIDLALRQYKDVCEYAQGKHVTPLMETNGMFSDSMLLKNFMDSVGYENCGVLWDIHHPYRYNGEDMYQTAENLEKYIKHVHVKDSIVLNGSVCYKLMGQGNIPVTQAMNALKKMGYDGYVSLEWVKRWNMDLEDPGIVLSHFVEYIKQFNIR